MHRLDHRHNFSPYFYLIYLSYPGLPPPLLSTSSMTLSPLPTSGILSIWRAVVQSPLTSFGPQMVLSLGTGLMFGKKREDLPFVWFVQTVCFVVFNKVCTSQVSFVPFHTLHHNPMRYDCIDMSWLIYRPSSFLHTVSHAFLLALMSPSHSTSSGTLFSYPSSFPASRQYPPVKPLPTPPYGWARRHYGLVRRTDSSFWARTCSGGCGRVG